MMIPGNCKACGSEFLYRENTAPEKKKFCKTCMAIRNTTYVSAGSYRQNKIDPYLADANKRMRSISEICAKAKKVGMSYGQYIAAERSFYTKLENC